VPTGSESSGPMPTREVIAIRLRRACGLVRLRLALTGSRPRSHGEQLLRLRSRPIVAAHRCGNGEVDLQPAITCSAVAFAAALDNRLRCVQDFLGMVDGLLLLRGLRWWLTTSMTR
jgi:hypothetical protein